MTIESNCAAVADRCWPHADDAAAQHAAPHRGMAIRRLNVKLDCRSGQQSAIGFNQCAPWREIDQRHLMSRPNPGAYDAV
ncbi:MAG: hypothetical protein ABJA66_07830, partial [Actinomycetota bacterium]